MPAKLCILLAALVVGGVPLSAGAQDFPSRSVRVVVPWPPSGNVDITARTLAPALGEALGQQVIVENRAGAGGTIGSAQVAKSPAAGRGEGALTQRRPLVRFRTRARVAVAKRATETRLRG